MTVFQAYIIFFFKNNIIAGNYGDYIYETSNKLKQTYLRNKQIYRFVSYIWAFTMYVRKSVFDSLQSDQHRCYSLIRKYHI